MKEVILTLIVTSCVYGISLYFIFLFSKNKEDRSTTKVLNEINDLKIDIIAIPKNYIINIVQDEKVVDTAQYADMVLNISDYIRNKSEKDKTTDKAPQKVFLKDVDFTEYKIIT